MSYDSVLLYREICRILRQTPCCSLNAVSKELQVSPRTIQNVVSRLIGRSFTGLREELLLTEIKSLLVTRPTLEIKEISYAMGYKSPRSFARAVKRVSGLTPGQIRLRVSRGLLGV